MCLTPGRNLAMAVFLLLAGMYLAACKGSGTAPEKDGGSEEVRREIGEAYDATKGYLKEKMTRLDREMDDRLEVLGQRIEDLRSRASAGAEAGREKADETLEALRQREEEVRERLEEFREAGAEAKEEAGERLKKAMDELEAAYRKARERYGSSEE